MTRISTGDRARNGARAFVGKTSRTACAATLAGALALTTATVAPARADGNGDAIAAAAFFGLVAAVLVATARSDRAHPGGEVLPPAVSPHRALPEDCRFDIRYGPDRGAWYGRQCLVSHYRDWDRLPGVCAERVELPRQRYDVVAYEARCLADYGLVRAETGHDGLHTRP